MPRSLSLPSLLLVSPRQANLTSVSVGVLLLDTPYNTVTDNVTFSVWLLSLSCRMLTFTHQVAGVSTLFLWFKKLPGYEDTRFCLCE